MKACGGGVEGSECDAGGLSHPSRSSFIPASKRLPHGSGHSNAAWRTGLSSDITGTPLSLPLSLATSRHEPDGLEDPRRVDEDHLPEELRVVVLVHLVVIGYDWI